MNLRKTLFILPNLFTLSSIFCGFDAIRLVAAAGDPRFEPQPYYTAALLLVFAMFFDIVDGRVARMTRTQSAFGLQIDSLADVISFGVAPAILTYRWALAGLGTLGLVASFVFVGCGAIRLARFNVLSMREKGSPSKPGKYIAGLPIPGAAGVIIAIVIANHSVRGSFFSRAELVAGLMILLSALMVSTVQFRSFKDLRLTPRVLALVALGVASTVGVSAQFGPAFALPWLLAVYITIGLVETVVTFPRRRADRRAAALVTVRADVPPPGDE